MNLQCFLLLLTPRNLTDYSQIHLWANLLAADWQVAVSSTVALSIT